jgi:hypothetical protein
MKKQFKKAIFIVASIALLVNACKEKEFINATLIPAVDNINTFFTDTFSIVTNNITFNNFRSDRLYANFQYQRQSIGVIANDPIFGATTCGLAFQLKQPTSALTFPNGNIIIDSLILSMPIVSFYGDSINGTSQKFNVYRLKTALNLTDELYNNTNVDYYKDSILGSGNIKFSNVDTTTLANGSKERSLRIALDTNFARTLTKLSDTTDYKTYANFAKWLRGLYVASADTTKGNLIGLVDLENIHMKFYFKNVVSTTKTDTLVYDYAFNSIYNKHVNTISHDFASNNPAIKNYVNSSNPLGDDNLYVQSDCGGAFTIKMPYLTSYNNALVNSAALDLTIIPSGSALSDSAYKAPYQLRAYYLDANGKTLDILPEISSGYRTRDTSNGQVVYKYTINITRNFQDALTKKKADFKLLIKGYNVGPGCGRVVLGGNKNLQYKSKLNVIYTKIN